MNSIKQQYKCGYIDTHYNRGQLTTNVIFDDITYPVKSTHAAKLLITRLIKKSENKWIVADDHYIYGIELSIQKAEYILSDVLSKGNCDAYIQKLHCGCSSEDISVYKNDEGQYSHFFCNYCGNNVDDNKYDRSSFATLLNN